jgi:predicted dehydrogenase
MNIGIIGIGYWGPNILRILSHEKHIHIKYICDICDNVLTNYKINFNCTTNYFDILNDPDINIVFIVTPISTHYKLIIDCLKHKKHVFVEKPLCKTVEQMNNIYELCKNNNVKIFCDYTFTHSDKISKLKNIIYENIEDIIYIEMNRETFGIFSYDNIIYDLLPHDISILKFIFNDTIKINYVDKIMHNNLFIKSIIHFTINDFNGIINISWLNESKVRKIKVFCKNKIIEYDDINDNIKIFNYYLNVNDNKIEQYKKNIDEIININYNEPLKVSIQQMLKMIENNDENIFNENMNYNKTISEIFEKIL